MVVMHKHYYSLLFIIRTSLPVGCRYVEVCTFGRWDGLIDAELNPYAWHFWELILDMQDLTAVVFISYIQ